MKPRIYTSEEHHIRNELIDPNALAVLKRLHEAGYLSYLVGGSVRDLLMRKRPKDFDISTAARPEEIKHLFRNSILIGRRFRLAHIRFGKQVIEVSTFRAGDPEEEELIIRDNIWGTPEEDVKRRDFTINGLFYDPLDHRIIDYVGGYEDLKQHMLRCIGDPILRFKQDPVRMIRMQKFRARFGFQVHPETLEALILCRVEITKSSPARLLEEIFRMLESGAAEPFFRLLYESEILKILFPNLCNYFEKEIAEALFAYLKAADAINHQGHTAPLDRSVLASSLVFPILEYEIKLRFLEQGKIPHIGEILDLAHAVIEETLFVTYTHFPRRIRLGMHFILHMQYRLTPLDRRKRPRTRLIRQKGFSHALTFLKLRTLIDPSLFKAYDQWKHLLKQAEKEKDNALFEEG